MRDRIGFFDRRFAELSGRQRKLISEVDERLLYARTDPQDHSLLPDSIGEFILRSAAMVEQMIGGITTRLWDDPVEWTLPEQMPTRNDLLGYLAEVEASRQRGFAFFKDDDELNKTLPAPVEFRSLLTVLEDTLSKAERLFDKASEIYLVMVPQNTSKQA